MPPSEIWGHEKCWLSNNWYSVSSKTAKRLKRIIYGGYPLLQFFCLSVWVPSAILDLLLAPFLAEGPARFLRAKYCLMRCFRFGIWVSGVGSSFCIKRTHFFLLFLLWSSSSFSHLVMLAIKKTTVPCV